VPLVQSASKGLGWVGGQAVEVRGLQLRSVVMKGYELAALERGSSTKGFEDARARRHKQASGGRKDDFRGLLKIEK
jgi:hypothetical protein